jgi:uncharacterized protein (DUF433 family)
MNSNWQNFISIKSDIRFGKPTIIGTQFVFQIFFLSLAWHIL